MAAGLIGDLVPPDQPADALILGFTMPDLSPGRATATYLSHVCPGKPMAFAICDQGRAVGFTALRLTRDYAAADGWSRVLVAVAEQARLDYDPPAPASVPIRHAAFAMLCDAVPVAAAPVASSGVGAPCLRAVRVCPAVPAEQVSATLGRELAALPEPAAGAVGEERRTLVLGEGLAPLTGDGVPGWRSILALPGQPATGVWRELAAWAAAPGGGGLTLADYDPALHYLCLASFARAG
ncbi:MAG: hypothetical protein JO345_10225 [Streptosporangiaceae bacterium]|nr:hypothetical protein [Streptosporangiaceae bacterium]